MSDKTVTEFLSICANMDGYMPDGQPIAVVARAVLAASEDRRDAERWRKARELFQAWEIDRAAENMIGGIPDEDECAKADNAIDAARAAAGNHKVEG